MKLQYAIAYAEEVHRDQKYGKDEPYTKHLRAVEEVLRRFGYEQDYLLVAAWLHDSVEDTETTIDEIQDMFGPKVGALVWAVTNEPGKNRAARHINTYKKIAAEPEAIILKLADRIANVEASILDNDKRLGMYRKEYKEFKDKLKTDKCEPMWRHLDFLLG